MFSDLGSAVRRRAIRRAVKPDIEGSVENAVESTVESAVESLCGVLSGVRRRTPKIRDHNCLQSDYEQCDD